ncbi:MAG: hypothetical protein CVU63_06765 [Deltaproteobacteria bacterium HGW-Deltaproteobacteria-20]|nr:MAG: hypothetical protein CVU63_06765 [Deltaproteobacteria bacterium HGW-Deltaproteobacteria-20]
MKCSMLAAAVGLLLVSTASTGFAQKPGRVITLNEVTIVGRVQRPIAAVDVARIRPKITLSELRQPFLGRIEEAIYKEPF